MKKNLSFIALLGILIMQIVLAIIPVTAVASAADNATVINDFTCNVTKGTVPLSTRLTADVSGDATNWLWAFHNTQFNKSSYSSSPGTTKHTFGRTGVYGVFNVTLVVSGPAGNATLKKIAYVVANKNTTGLPIAGFSASTTSGDVPLSVSFTDNSTDASSFIWYFGNRDTSTEKNPTHTFTSPGKYRVVLVVNNTNGWDAIAQEIVVTGEQQESILPEAHFETDTSNGLIVQFTDLSLNEDSFTWDFGDGSNSTEYSPAHTYAAAGEYTVNLTVSNENGVNSLVKTISVGEGSSSNNDDDDDDDDDGGSGGGGSGISVSPELQSNVEVKETSQTFISNGNSIKFDFTQEATPVTNISFDSEKTIGKTTAIIEMLKNQSTLVSEPPSDEVYKFVNMWIGKGGFATPKNIKNAVIDFKVEKSWVQDKNIDKSSITLNRYNETTWDQLKTTLIGEDDKYFYFAAETPEFASFAITGEIAAKETEIQPEIKDNIESDGHIEKNAEQQTENEDNTNASEKTTSTPGFEMIYGVSGLFGIFLYRRRKAE